MSQQASASALQDPAFLQLPALTPPPGVIPNFTNPDNRGPTLIVVGAIFLALVVIALTNRAYTKLFIVRKASWDDLTIFLSAVGAIVWYTICSLRKGASAFSSTRTDEQFISEIRIDVIGRHQYEVRLGDLLNNNFIIVIVVLCFQ